MGLIGFKDDTKTLNNRILPKCSTITAAGPNLNLFKALTKSLITTTQTSPENNSRYFKLATFLA